MKNNTNKVKICHLTVLNPAIHSRIFFKEAKTQQAAGYSVSIIGKDKSKQIFERDGIRIIPIRNFQRFSIFRFFAPLIILIHAIKESATIYQIHSPELFRIIFWLKCFNPKAKIIYDVHENYVQNFLHGASLAPIIRHFFAAYVKLLEYYGSLFISGYVLAENSYTIPGFNRPHVYVSNKSNISKAKQDIAGSGIICYTGTISEKWGIFKCLEFWIQLNKISPTMLKVAGHSEDSKLIKEIKGIVEEHSLTEQFELIGGNEYVEHEKIMAVLNESCCSCAFYDVSNYLAKKTPTKFYEGMAMGKAVLFSKNESWELLNDELHFGHALTFPLDSEEVEKISVWIRRGSFPEVNNNIEKAHWHWDGEGEKLLKFLSGLL